jgi:hypothetical protein
MSRPESFHRLEPIKAKKANEKLENTAENAKPRLVD